MWNVYMFIEELLRIFIELVQRLRETFPSDNNLLLCEKAHDKPK
jgi:hypothetical protein